MGIACEYLVRTKIAVTKTYYSQKDASSGFLVYAYYYKPLFVTTLGETLMLHGRPQVGRAISKSSGYKPVALL
jgi:hypothetical protein